MQDSYGGITGYAYDREDRLSEITTPWGAKIAQSYDFSGRPLRLSYPNGLDADISFEAQTGRLASLQHRAGTLSAPIASYSHSYNALGNIASQTELTNTKTFNYDKLARLTGVQQTNPAPATQVESYTYDPAGNRIEIFTWREAGRPAARCMSRRRLPSMTPTARSTMGSTPMIGSARA